MKGSTKQRLHPGMLSTQDHATAHYGSVTGLRVTEDGLYLLSAGGFLFNLRFKHTFFLKSCFKLKSLLFYFFSPLLTDNICYLCSSISVKYEFHTH